MNNAQIVNCFGKQLTISSGFTADSPRLLTTSVDSFMEKKNRIRSKMVFIRNESKE